MNQIDYNLYEQRHMFIGKASFVLALVGMILYILGIVLMFVGVYFGMILIYPGTILTSLGLILGAISYFGPFKVTYGLVAFIIALITTCIIPILTVVASWSAYMYASSAMSGFL